MMSDRLKPLDDLVNRMREKTGKGREIPRFSRHDGGTAARCLFLFKTPNGTAVESGFIQMENDDPSARNFKRAMKRTSERAGLDQEQDRRLTASWNIVPWSAPEAKPADARAALWWLGELLGLLPDLRVVVLLGGTAREATEYLYLRRPDLCVLHAPHPSNQSLGPHPERREHLHAAVEKAIRKARR